MYKTVRKLESTPRKISDKAQARNYITKDISPTVSLAVLEGNNCSEKVFTAYNRIYYVFEGTLKLSFGSEKILLKEGDSFFVSSNTDYLLAGTFKTVVVNEPAFGT